ncbi:MAG: ribosomal protein large subunit ribosomal protein [Parcubacteria group bacterium]|nr:ribosomal protein large subunit ribosomal protein [Parcubacteria group bacterium]
MSTHNVITPVKTDERSKLGIRPGDTVRVHQKVIEKGKTRLQVFEGLVLAVKHGTEPGATFTVRAMMSGVGVEKIFPLYSPVIDKIEIVRRSKVRRAKLYFIREKVAREVRRQLRNMRMMNVSTDDFKEEEVPEEVSVEEVIENDPTEIPTGEEMTPVEEEEGAPEIVEIEETTEEKPAE